MIDKMPLYKYAAGKEVPGLEARRAAEVDLAGPVSYDKLKTVLLKRKMILKRTI